MLEAQSSAMRQENMMEPNLAEPTSRMELHGILCRAQGEKRCALAAELAQRCGVALLHDSPARDRLHLVITEQDLSLRPPRTLAARSLRIDFTAPALVKRYRAGYRREFLARAIGISRGLRRVMDCTTGLGRESFLLAAWGCEVEAVERSPVIHALVDDALDRARATGDELARIAERIVLRLADAKQVLQAQQFVKRPEVIYLDPMLGDQGQQARVSKEMALLRGLLGPDLDCQALVRLALATASRRIVIKRPLRTEPLLPGVAASYGTGAHRYDMYVVDGSV
jgi:16S rRNA (guanine1516-N2)-methyltransferase